MIKITIDCYEVTFLTEKDLEIPVYNQYDLNYQLVDKFQQDKITGLCREFKKLDVSGVTVDNRNLLTKQEAEKIAEVNGVKAKYYAAYYR